MSGLGVVTVVYFYVKNATIKTSIQFTCMVKQTDRTRTRTSIIFRHLNPQEHACHHTITWNPEDLCPCLWYRTGTCNVVSSMRVVITTRRKAAWAQIAQWTPCQPPLTRSLSMTRVECVVRFRGMRAMKESPSTDCTIIADERAAGLRWLGAYLWRRWSVLSGLEEWERWRKAWAQIAQFLGIDALPASIDSDLIYDAGGVCSPV